MQGDRAHAALVEMTVDFEGIALVVESTEQGLVQRRQAITDNIHHRPVHLFDGADSLAHGLHGLGSLFHVD